MYLDKGFLEVELIDSEVAWLDTGTHQNLLEAGKFIETFENRQGIKIGCIEEVCYNNRLISKDQLNDLADNMPVNEYSIYIKNINNRKDIDG